MCDVRAACNAVPNVEVECRCEAVPGLHSKPGVLDDGSESSQDLSVESVIAQHSTLLLLTKPGESESVTWRLVASGESSLTGAIQINAALSASPEC
jgi:hypothetical protein